MAIKITIEKQLGTLLRLGTLFSSLIVLIGGTWYLAQHGNDQTPFALWQQPPTLSSMQTIWQLALTFTPLGIVQLGLLILVITQVLRVGLLFIYYASTRDAWFTFFCGFVLMLLIYSLYNSLD